jgi:Polyketide cyclase / dehydrase and lipid transport
MASGPPPGTRRRPYTRCVHVMREIVLPTTLEEAWAVLVDWERQADWMLDADRVDVVSAHREGVGVRLAVKTRLFGVPAFTEPMEVTAWEPSRRLEMRHGSLVAGAGVWELGETDGGTRFRWSEDIALRVPLVGELAARAYRPVMRMLMSRAQRSLRAYVIAIGPVR